MRFLTVLWHKGQMEDDQDQLRLSLARKREILWAAAWRGVLFSFLALLVTALIVYIATETIWRFFLNDNYRMNAEQTAYLYLWLAVPAVMLGWLAAVSRILHIRYSHFRITLTATQLKKPNWLSRVIGSKKPYKRDH